MLTAGTVYAADKANLEKYVGQPVDIAPWAYAWRADQATQQTPEAYFIPRRLARIDKTYRTAAAALPPDQLKSIFYNMPDMLKPFPPAPKARLSAGLLWTGRLSKLQVELHWPEGVEIPAADAVEIRTYPTSFGWFGWTVDRVLGEPKVSADRRTWTYTSDTPADKMDSAYNQRVDAATEMVAVFCDSSVVPTIALTSPQVGNWKRIDVEIEGPEVVDRFETYMAVAGPATKLPLTKGPVTRQGFSVPVLYAPDARPGLDSRLTIRTKHDRFTIRLRDLEDGPILAAHANVVVMKAGSGLTAFAVGQTLKSDWKSDWKRPLQWAVERHPEAASWEQLMQNVRLWNCPPGTKAPATLPAVADPPMTVDISADPHWTDAWRAACDQLRGKHMWGGLAFEVGRVAHEMELVGLQDEAAKVYDHFLSAPGAKSDGDYTDGDGALELAASMRHDIGFSHDGTHASTGRLLFAMAERYFLTGDRAWFEQHRARLQKAADWIIRQRRSYLAEAPNRADMLAAGLMPPHMLGDYALPSCDWHFYYCDDAFSLQALSRFADVLAEIDPAAAKPYRDEADAYRKDLRAVIQREAELSPLRRGRDGMFHRFVPRMAYTRGLTGPEIGAPQFPDCDYFMNCLPLAEPFAAIDASDPIMVETLDVMDEMGTAAFAPANQAAKKQKNLSADDAWFWTAYSRLPKASHNANIYLLQDDVPSFLRFWMNEYAIMVGADGKFWEGWQPDNFNACAAPDNGTAGWFVENFRDLLVMEDGKTLWLARATPRAWLAQGKTIRVKNVPTYFGPTGYEIVSDVDHKTIRAAIELPSRTPPETMVLRLRHPAAASLHDVTVNGEMWTAFDPKKETITLKAKPGILTVTAKYQ